MGRSHDGLVATKWRADKTRRRDYRSVIAKLGSGRSVGFSEVVDVRAEEHAEQSND